MPFYSVRLTLSVSGQSLNTTFSAVLTSIPAGFHLMVGNESASRLAFAIATSAPTVTVADQFYVPNSGSFAFDAGPGEYVSPPQMPSGNNWNLYARCDSGSVASACCFYAIFHY